MSSVTLLVISLLVCAMLGVLLLVVGLRGRRVDDHQLCRKCRFDLSGAPASSDRCPECGHDVRGPRGIVVGHRVKRRWPLVVGTLCLFLSLTPMSVVGLFVARGVEWRTKVPTWYALLEARGTIPGTREAAVVELFGRHLAGGLNPEQQLRFAEVLISIQKDQSVRWQNQWGDFLVNQAIDDKLPANLRDQFFAIVIGESTFDLRRVVRAGTRPAIWFNFNFPAPAFTNGSLLRIQFAMNDREMRVDGHPKLPQTSTDRKSVQVFGGNTQTVMNDLSTFWRDTRPGTYRVEYRVPMNVVIEKAGIAKRTVYSFVTEKSFELTVVAPDEPDVIRIVDESLRPTFEKAVSVERIVVWTGHESGYFRVKLKQPLPIDGAYKVYLRQDGKEHMVRKVVLRAGLPSEAFPSMIDYKANLVSGKADIIFRPDEEAARATPDILEIWDGVIVLHDVTVVAYESRPIDELMQLPSEP